MTTPDGGDGRAAGADHGYFTDREPFLARFRRMLDLPEGSTLPVIAFHGVGGVGKTMLIDRLGRELDALNPPIPHARFNIDNLRSPASAAREVLLKLRSDLEFEFRLEFPRYDDLLTVLIAMERGEPPPLVKSSPALMDTFDLVLSVYEMSIGAIPVGSIPLDAITGFVERQARKSKTARRWLAKAGGCAEILRLRDRVRRDDPTLADELIERFADDLVAGLPVRPGHACRGCLFFDTFETLWKGSDAGLSVQAKQLDAWLRQLCKKLQTRGVLVAAAGRDRLWWADEPDWKSAIETHLLDGLSRQDAQIYLAKRAIGPNPYNSETPLQTAILDACSIHSGRESEAGCHPFYLALCADIVDNFREKNGGDDPSVDLFTGAPGDDVAARLADRFLKSLPNERWELWVRELSLTPMFDERAALELDRDRHHNLGRAGWKQLRRYSFVEPQTDGRFRLHKTMRDVLVATLDDDDANDVHAWFRDHWTSRDESALAFYHRWSLDPEASLDSWREEHRIALKERRITAARALLDAWSEISLDGADRRRLGDSLWARTHHEIGHALWTTPLSPRAPSLFVAIDHYESALEVYTELEHPTDWASTQNNLGLAYVELPTGDRGENLRRAIACYESALRVRTESGHPTDWATTQNNLGVAYGALPTGDRGENLRRAIACYESALRVYTDSNLSLGWAMTQNNLGNALCELRTGDRGNNLRRAIACYESALEVYTESEYPTNWASTQNNLGAAYSVLPTGDRGENLRRAVGCYESVLRVHTESDYPSAWARTQINLGASYSALPTGDRGENLRRAIACYESALRVYNESDYPSAWATTQYNLGYAYNALPTGDRGENLRRAIACYESASRVRTESAYPLDWARTQYNLGYAYWVQPTGDREENVRRAVACYESVLRVHTESAYPSYWSMTQYNLGLALRALKRFDGSALAFECAARGFKKLGDENAAKNARGQASDSRRMKDDGTAS